MSVVQLLIRSLAIYGLATTLVFADAKIVEHDDPIEVDPKLTLAQLVTATMEKYPDITWLKALQDEAKAIEQRSRSWTAGSATASLRFQEATSGTLHYVDAGVQVPLWNPGQRNAEKLLSQYAESSSNAQTTAVKLTVAGLVRNALWDIALQSIRHEQAVADMDIAEKLMDKVERRVRLGDLPMSDLLLADTERLQKLSVLTDAEAELMHARKRYSNITRSNKIPADYGEQLVALKQIQLNHPALQAINSQIERKQAELRAVKLIGSGQSSLAVGINSDRPSADDPRSNDTESFNIGINVPFGGDDHLAPQLAAVNVEIAKLMSEREQLYRDLEQAHHEAEHNLEVNEAQLQITHQLQQTAEDHLKMMQISFSAGEINLMDLLKVQANTRLAVLHAKERTIMLERDKALYNQAVGVMP